MSSILKSLFKGNKTKNDSTHKNIIKHKTNYFKTVDNKRYKDFLIANTRYTVEEINNMDNATLTHLYDAHAKTFPSYKMEVDKERKLNRTIASSQYANSEKNRILNVAKTYLQNRNEQVSQKNADIIKQSEFVHRFRKLKNQKDNFDVAYETGMLPSVPNKIVRGGRTKRRKYIRVKTKKAYTGGAASNHHDVYGEFITEQEEEDILINYKVNDTVKLNSNNQYGVKLYIIDVNDEGEKYLKIIGDMYGEFTDPYHPDYIGGKRKKKVLRTTRKHRMGAKQYKKQYKRKNNKSKKHK